MKNLRLLLMMPVVIGLSVCFYSCEPPKEEGSGEDVAKVKLPEALKGMVELDLTNYGLPMLLMVPDTSETALEIIAQDWGDTEIRVGSHFQIQIAEGGNIELKKQDLEDDLLYKVNYVSEESDGILYNQQIDGSDLEPAFHFYNLIKNGDLQYEVQDINTGEGLPKVAMERMFESAKFIKIKPNV